MRCRILREFSSTVLGNTDKTTRCVIRSLTGDGVWVWSNEERKQEKIHGCFDWIFERTELQMH